MCPSTSFSRTNCSLGRYNVKCKLDCFNYKTGEFSSDYSLQCLQKKAITIHVLEKENQLLHGEYLRIIKKNCFHSADCCINSALSNSKIINQFSQTLVNIEVYPSELLSVQDQTSIVSKHNTEIFNHLLIVKNTW